ncbi:hypothetical protein LJD47_25325, partial [Escherichia coli]|nr:hypothetical protein [Escherichia coli]
MMAPTKAEMGALATPRDGMPNQPRMNAGVQTIEATVAIERANNGVTASDTPRLIDVVSQSVKMIGIPASIVR